MIPESGRSHARRVEDLNLGSHSDDIEIGCGGAILRLAEQYPGCTFIGFCSVPRVSAPRRLNAPPCALLVPPIRRCPVFKTFQDGFLPFVGAEVKAVFEELKREISPT